MENIIQQTIAVSRKKNLESFDHQQFALQTWLMYMGADIAETGSKNLEEMLRKVGNYTHERKMNIEKMKHIARILVRDVDTQCDRDFSCDFAEIAEEITEAVMNILTKRMKSLQNGTSNEDP